MTNLEKDLAEIDARVAAAGEVWEERYRADLIAHAPQDLARLVRMIRLLANAYDQDSAGARAYIPILWEKTKEPAG